MPIFVPQNKFMNREKLYNDLSGFLAMHFPCKVQKISINAGFTCPNRDGSVGYGGCTYCNNQTFNPAYCHTEKSVTQQLEEGKRFFVRKYPEMKYLAYFQAYTNTYGEKRIKVQLFDLRYVRSIVFQNSKNRVAELSGNGADSSKMMFSLGNLFLIES